MSGMTLSLDGLTSSYDMRMTVSFELVLFGFVRKIFTLQDGSRSGWLSLSEQQTYLNLEQKVFREKMKQRK